MSKKKSELLLGKGIKIAAIYLIISGALDFLFPLLYSGPPLPEYEALLPATKLGAHTRYYAIAILFLVSGIGILKRKVWARKMALIMLVVSVIYASTAFAWGLADGPPSLSPRLIAIVILSLWNGLWFYLIYKNKPVTHQEKTDDSLLEIDDRNRDSSSTSAQPLASESTQATITKIRKCGRLKRLWLFRAFAAFIIAFIATKQIATSSTGPVKEALLVTTLVGVAVVLLCIYYVSSSIIKIKDEVIFLEKPFSISLELMMSDIQGIEKNPEYLKISVNDKVPLLIRRSEIHSADWEKLKGALGS